MQQIVFPLDNPEFCEFVWLKECAVEQIKELFADPHRWIREQLDARPEQVLGCLKKTVAIMVNYVPAEDTGGMAVVEGVLDTNIVHVRLPKVERPFDPGALVRSRPLEMKLQSGAAIGNQRLTESDDRDAFLEQLFIWVQNPVPYIQTLNELKPFAKAGFGGNALSNRIRLEVECEDAANLRFVYLWYQQKKFMGPGNEGLTDKVDSPFVKPVGRYAPVKDDEPVTILIHEIFSAPNYHIAMYPPALISPVKPTPRPAEEQKPATQEEPPAPKQGEPGGEGKPEGEGGADGA